MKLKTFGWVLGLCAGAAFMASAGEKPAMKMPSLLIGAPAPAIGAMAWIQGEPVKSFKPGHVYVVEFWATWCGPCNMVMPHLSELQKKHATDLTIIGVNVRESQNGKAEIGAVTEFVKKKGDKMAYTVAMDDPVKKTVFDTYMTAGGSYGIPTSFIVGRDGKIAWIGYPTVTDGYNFDAALADALSGKSDLAQARKLQEQVAEGTAKRLYEMDLMKDVYEARKQKDFKQVVAEADKVAVKDPEYVGQMFTMKLGALLHVDEAEAMKLAESNAKDASLHKQLRVGDEAEYWGVVGSTISREKDLSKDAYQKAVGYLQKATAAKPDSWSNWLSLADLQYSLGNKDQAVIAQERAISIASTTGLPSDMVDAFKKKLQTYKGQTGKG